MNGGMLNPENMMMNSPGNSGSGNSDPYKLPSTNMVPGLTQQQMMNNGQMNGQNFEQNPEQ